MVEKQALPIRALRQGEENTAKPFYAVWELTMRCDQPCQHCGSRAGRAREVELDTAQVIEVGQSLARLGCREVALIGGEAYLRKDLPMIVRSLADQGLRVLMQTGGRTLTSEMAVTLKEAGMAGVGFSIDGPPHVHDELRGNSGSHAAAFRAMDACHAAGLVVSGNSQINRLNYQLLPEIADELQRHGAQAWQVQLTVAMGRAADRPEWILEPFHVVDVIDSLAAIQRKAIDDHVDGIPFNVFCGNNIGYFGPHEELLRSVPGTTSTHWGGCRAGVNTIGIESDGTVKACPSLPTAPYDGGNVREVELEQIWKHSEQIRFSRDRTSDELWGHCATCYYADTCRAGCSWLTHCTFGKRGNNPFCYYRVKKLQRKGIRERLVQRERAPNVPYDFGRFEILEEPWQDDDAEPDRAKRLPVIRS